MQSADLLKSAVRKWPSQSYPWPISLLREIFYPRNINHMHPKGTSFGASAVKPELKMVVRLDLDQICLFLDGH
jgi:hypothetical protein